MYPNTHSNYPYPYFIPNFPFPYPHQLPHSSPNTFMMNQQMPKIEDYNPYNQPFPYFAEQYPINQQNSSVLTENVDSGKKIHTPQESEIPIKNEEIQQVEEKEKIVAQKIIYKQKTTKKQDPSQKKIKDNINEEDLYEPEIIHQKEGNLLSPYPKKNTESNIVNQIFSYVSSPNKSMEKLMKIFKNKSKVVFYYQLIKCVKKGKKKYINRKYLINLTKIEESHPGYKLFKRGKGSRSTISLEEFRMAINKLIWIYLDIECVLTITTSKKLATETWGQHLQRRRQIQQFFTEKAKQN